MTDFSVTAPIPSSKSRDYRYHAIVYSVDLALEGDNACDCERNLETLDRVTDGNWGTLLRRIRIGADDENQSLY